MILLLLAPHLQHFHAVCFQPITACHQGTFHQRAVHDRQNTRTWLHCHTTEIKAEISEKTSKIAIAQTKLAGSQKNEGQRPSTETCIHEFNERLVTQAKLVLYYIRRTVSMGVEILSVALQL
jgi:hypothetical protein